MTPDTLRTLLDSGAATIGFLAFLYLVFSIGRQLVASIERLSTTIQSHVAKTDQMLMRLAAIETRLNQEDK